MMNDFLKKYWKWILLLALIAVGCYISAWYYFNVLKGKKEEAKSGET